MGQCDCHNYKCDLSADREHGERVKLATHRHPEGEGCGGEERGHTDEKPPTHRVM